MAESQENVEIKSNIDDDVKINDPSNDDNKVEMTINDEKKQDEQSYYEDQQQRQREREQKQNKNDDKQNDNNSIDKKDDTKSQLSGNSQEENVWQDFLKDALSKGKKKQQGTLVVLGSKTSGKTSLIGQFKKLETRSGEMKKFLMMRYSYVELESDEDKSENLLHIYQLADAEHCKVLDVVIPPSHMEHLSYMICLDFSRPYEVENEFKLWINVIKETQERLLSRLPVERQQQLKDKLYKHVQRYQNPHSAEQEPLTEEEKSKLEIKKDSPEINLSVPIIVVSTKVDLFKKLFAAEADASDHYDIILSYIRLWSLKYGAASFTMAKNLKDQARRILSYLDHRMFETPFSRAPNEVVSLTNLNEQFLFIPSGHDTVDLIKTQGQNRPFEDPFTNYFPPPKQNSKKNKEDTFQPKSDNEGLFLKLLEFEIQQAPNSKDKSSNPAQSTKNTAAVHKFFNHLLQGQTPSKPAQNPAPTNP